MGLFLLPYLLAFLPELNRVKLVINLSYEFVMRLNEGVQKLLGLVSLDLWSLVGINCVFVSIHVHQVLQLVGAQLLLHKR